MTVETQYIDKLREAAKTRYVRTYWLACAFMPRSAIRTKRSPNWKDRMRTRICFLPRARIDPAMDPLRDDPRFKEILKRLNLPV